MAAQIRHIDDVVRCWSAKLIEDLMYALNDGPVSRMAEVQDDCIHPWLEKAAQTTVDGLRIRQPLDLKPNFAIEELKQLLWHANWHMLPLASKQTS